LTSTVLGPFGAPFRKLSSALYLVSIMLIMIPCIDFISSIIPYLPGSTKWRFASGSLFAGFLLTPILGIALAMLVAGMMQHRGVLRLISIGTLISAFVLVAWAALLALDVVELRATTEADVKMAVIVSGARAILKDLFIAGTLGVISMACRRAANMMEPPRGEVPMAPIVGSPRR
jgi:hypothetical protein